MSGDVDYSVELNRKPAKNQEPERTIEPDLEELRDKSSVPIVFELVDGRPKNFTPEMIKQEMTLEYTEPVQCPYCRANAKIVFRESDEKYSIKKNRKVNIVGKKDYPIWIPIDVAKTQRDQFGNYQSEYGDIVPHICKVETMGEDDLRAFIKQTHEQQTEFNKWVFHQLKDIRETAMFKPVVMEYYDP